MSFFDYLMDDKLGYMAGAVIRPLGIDVTVDKDDLIKMSRDQFHQACGHQWGGVLDVTQQLILDDIHLGSQSHAFIVPEQKSNRRRWQKKQQITRHLVTEQSWI